MSLYQRFREWRHPGSPDPELGAHSSVYDLEAPRRAPFTSRASLLDHQLGQLDVLAAALCEARSTEQVIATLLEHGLDALGASRGSLALVPRGDVSLFCVASRGGGVHVLEDGAAIALDASHPAARAVRDGHVVLVGHDGEPRVDDAHHAAMVLMLPLEQGELRGCLAAQLEPRASSVLGGRYARTLAALASQALARARAEEDVAHARERFEELLDGVQAERGKLARAEKEERELAEQALRDSEAHLRLALRSARMGTWDWDLVTNRVLWSEPADHEAFGFEGGTFCGTFEQLEQRVHPDDRAALRRRMDEAREAHTMCTHDFRLVWPDESIHWVRSRGLFEYDEQGRATRLRGVVMETTQQRLTVEALRLSEERYRQVFENNVTASFVADPDGRLVAVNSAFVRLFELESARTAVGTNLSALYAAPSVWHAQVAALEHGEPLSFQPLELHTMSQKPLHVVANLVASHNAQGELVRINGSLLDETARRLLEEQLGRAAKLEATGRLAGGVAHEFNNLLTMILSASQLMLRGGELSDSMKRRVEQVIAAAERAAALTAQLLAFSRRQVLSPSRIYVNHLIESGIALLTRVMPDKVRLEADLSPSAGYVRVDAGQLEQVLTDLVNNARDAMPHGGTIRVSTSGVTLSERDIVRRPGLAPGAYARLVVSDSGTGMDAETRARLFEPFFSTKGVGKGTGLGLASAYGIVKQSGGHIDVESEPGRGTSVSIYLPSC